MCVCVCTCVHVCMHVNVWVCLHTTEHAYTCIFSVQVSTENVKSTGDTESSEDQSEN